MSSATDPLTAAADEIDVDGHVDLRGIEYIGKATRQPDGTWRCLAKIPHGADTALCVVECKITLQPPSTP